MNEMSVLRHPGGFGSLPRWLVAAGLACASASSAAALAAQPVFSVGDAVRASLAMHPSIALAESGVRRAESAVAEARGARRPTLAVNAVTARYAEPMVVAPLHGFTPNLSPTFDRTLAQGSIVLGYTLFDGGRVPRIERAEALVSASASGGESMRQRLIARVLTTYLAVGSAREVAAAHEARVVALEQERSRAAQLVEVGRAARVALLRAEAALSAARAEQLAAAGEVEAVQHELARLVGVSAESIAQRSIERLALGSEAAVVNRQAELERALQANDQLEELRWRVAAARAGEEEARAQRLPRVQLTGRYVEYASSLGRESGEWQAGVQLDHALLSGGTRAAAQERSAADLNAARAELALAELGVADAIDRATARYEAALGRVAALETAAAQSEEVARIERLALAAGSGVQTDYLAAEAELLRVRAALGEAREAAVGARVELALLGGELDEVWVARNLEVNF
jgi:outer membrane protein